MLPKWVIICSVALAILAHSDSSSARFLIWDADSNANSGPVIRTALYGASYEGDYTTDINPYIDSLSNYCAIFICLGVHDSRFVLTPGPIVDSLVGYLNAGGKIYMEGGDTWAYDTTTALHPYFKIIGDWDGIGDVGTVLGQTGTFTEGMTFTYSPSADNKYMDRLLLDSLSTAFVVFENQSASYVNGIAYDDGVGSYKTVGVSFEFGGLEDALSPSMKTDLADSIMGFFGCPPAIYNLNVGVISIISPWSWTLPNTPLIPQARVKNLGIDTVTFDVTCVIDSLGDTIYTDTQPVVDLISDSTRQVNFSSWTPAGVDNCYNVTIYTQLTGDQMTVNDTLEMTTCVFDTTWEIASQYTYNPPIIDGFMAPGEWTDATQRDVSNIFDKNPSLSYSGAVYFYVKNDDDSVYFAVDAIADTIEMAAFPFYDIFWAFLEDNNDGAWPIWPLPIEGEFQIQHDTVYGDSVGFSALNSDSCNWWTCCLADRGQYATALSGHMQYEVALSLSLIPDTTCWGYAGIQASPCDTIGLWLAVEDVRRDPVEYLWIGWWPTNAGFPDTGQCVPGKMGSLILACSGNAFDAGVVSLDAPPDTVCPGSLYNVRATVRNFGTLILDSIAAVCIIDTTGGNAYTGYGTVRDLEPGEDTLVMFIPWMVPPVSPDSFTMTVTITATGDTLTGNNSLSKTLYNCETIGIEERLARSRLPKVFSLSRNRPNPFSHHTTIAYALPKRSAVNIKVFDVAGNEVRALVSGLLEPGFYGMSWDGTDGRNKPIASGVYFLRMEAGTFKYVRKMVLLN